MSTEPSVGRGSLSAPPLPSSLRRRVSTSGASYPPPLTTTTTNTNAVRFDAPAASSSSSSSSAAGVTGRPARGSSHPPSSSVDSRRLASSHDPLHRLVFEDEEVDFDRFLHELEQDAVITPAELLAHGVHPGSVNTSDELLLGFVRDSRGMGGNDDFDTEVAFTVQQPSIVDENVKLREKKLFAALREQKERLEKLRERNQQLTEALRTTREELQHEAEVAAERARLNAGSNILANLDLFMATDIAQDTSQTKKLQKRRKIFSHGVEMEEDDIDDFLITDAGCCSRFYHSILQCCAKSRRFLFPFEKDVDFIEVRFGKAIGVYFQFFRVMVLAAVYMSIAIFVTHIFHFIALDTGAWGDRALPQWMLLSSYSSREANMYIFLLVAILVYYVCFIIVRIVREERISREGQLEAEHDKRRKYSRVTLNLWDHSIRDAQSAEDYRLSIAETYRILTAEATREERLKSRTRGQWIGLVFRRIFGNFVVLIVVLSSWIGLLYLSVFRSNVQSYVEQTSLLSGLSAFIGPLAIVFINAITPEISEMITNFEKWDDPGTHIKWLVARLFFLKIATVLIVLFQQYILITGVTVTAFGLSYSITSSFDCPADQAAIELFQILLTTFVVWMTSGLFRMLWFSFRRCVSSKSPQKKEFKVAFKVINIIYFQVLFWVSLPFAPFVGVLSATMLLVYFKFQQRELKSVWKKPNDAFSARETGSYFLKFFIAAFILAFSVFVYWMDYHTNSSCGVYRIAPLTVYIREQAQSVMVLGSFYSIATEAVFLWAAFIVALTLLLKRAYFMNLLQSYLVIQNSRFAKEKEDLQSTIRRQREEIQRLQGENDDDANAPPVSALRRRQSAPVQLEVQAL